MVPSTVKLLYRQTKKAQSERSNRVPEGGKRSHRKRLKYQPQTSKSTRHRHCRATLRVYRDDHPSRPLPIHKYYRRAVNAQKSIHKYPQSCTKINPQISAKSAVNPQKLPTRSQCTKVNPQISAKIRSQSTTTTDAQLMHKSQSTNIRNHAQKSIHKYPQSCTKVNPQISAVNPQKLPTRSKMSKQCKMSKQWRCEVHPIVMIRMLSKMIRAFTEFDDLSWISIVRALCDQEKTQNAR